jgi:hypothetical protein
MSIFPCNWSSRALALALAVAPAYSQQLAIEEATVSDFAGGMGLPDGYEFTAGQKAHLLARVRGFKLNEQRHISLEFTVEAVDCNGVRLAPPVSGTVQRRVSERVQDFAPFIQAPVDVPAVPRAGMHAFHVRVTDKVAGQQASLEVPFAVASSFDDPADTLTIERFRFHESEYAEKPLAGEAAFRRGDSVWGRFLLTGFRMEANNRYDLQYSVLLKNVAGRTVFKETKAAAESKESFYPKSHVDGVISVALERSIRPGKYTLVIAATDGIGKQQATAEFAFRVTE